MKYLNLWLILFLITFVILAFMDLSMERSICVIVIAVTLGLLGTLNITDTSDLGNPEDY